MPLHPSATDSVTTDVTCLGCGCACDDIAVTVRGGRIAEARDACAKGVTWFGDGVVPGGARADGRDTSLELALAAAARMVASATRVLVYLAPDLSCEAQRASVALADALRAHVDSVTSSTGLGFTLAAQERGRVAATLGELRNRADVVVCWGVDPGVEYPRYWSRYVPMPAGLHVPGGRASRTVIAVDIGEAAGPADADHRWAVPPGDEVATLTALRSVVLEGAPQAASHAGDDAVATAIWARAGALAPSLAAGRYVLIVAEQDREHGSGDTARASALIALAQALNGPTRCALGVLRAGGNTSGADSVLTAQTGYPLAVDFGRGYPRYRPHDGTASVLGVRREIDAAIVVGAADGVPADVVRALAHVPAVLIGPRATTSPWAAARVAIDTGIAGIHDAGTALRMDDVPLPLRAVMSGPPAAASVVSTLRGLVVGTDTPRL